MTRPYALLKRCRAGAVVLLTVVSACSSGPSVRPNPPPEPDTTPTLEANPQPGQGLEFDICTQALHRPSSKRAYQGREGWFFHDFDLREDHQIFEQAEFVTELSRALTTQGVALVVEPVPGRAVVRPNLLYPKDPLQTAFSVSEADAYYDAYAQALRADGVAVVNVLAVARAFDAGGGKTFFKRDIHWTPEGANAVAEEAARIVRQVAKDALPTTELMLTHKPDKTHLGPFINGWLRDTCGYVLPTEPLGNYEVLRPRGTAGVAEVVLVGSSFGIAPYEVGFLGVALQSDVLNMSVGGGGALLALESYLLSNIYNGNRPQVLVWEFPIYVDALADEAQRRLLAAAYGSCQGDSVRFSHTQAVTSSEVMRLNAESLAAPKHYLSFKFDDVSLLRFGVTLRYQGGDEETLMLQRPARTADRNRGRYFTTLRVDADALRELALILPETATGTVMTQVCHTP